MRRLALVGGLVSSLVVWACAQGGTSDIDPITDAPLDASVNPDEDSGKLPNSSTEDGGKDAGDAGKPSDAAADAVVDAGCSGKVVINELKTGGSSATDEFIELYNPNSCTITMSGWDLMYSSDSGSTPSSIASLTSAHTIKPNGYFILAGGGYAGTKDIALTSGLKDTGARIAIVDASKKVLDSLGYGSLSGGNTYVEGTAAAAPAVNKSIGRKPDGKDTDNNSADFSVMTTLTPGAANN